MTAPAETPTARAAAPWRLSVLAVAETHWRGRAARVHLLALAPDGWAHAKRAPEFADGAPHPLDRWSRRAVAAIAEAVGGEAASPSDGPPWPPFAAWALASGMFWTSPLGMLTHRGRGLFAAFRGAVLTTAQTPETAPPAPAPHPCPACAQPCRTACPAAAFAADGYDPDRCADHVASPAGASCRAYGCLARRACPLGPPPPPDQAAFHMNAFLAARDPKHKERA